MSYCADWPRELALDIRDFYAKKCGGRIIGSQPEHGEGSA